MILSLYIDFSHIAASNTANDDVTNHVIHRTFHTDLQHSCAHLILKIDEKCSRTDGF